MLASYTPFLLGIVLQIGAAVGVAITGPKGDDSRTKEARSARALDIDSSQVTASLVTIIAAALLAPDLSIEVRALVATVGATLTAGAPALFNRLKAPAYRKLTVIGLTPLNDFMILFNVAACLLVRFWN